MQDVGDTFLVEVGIDHTTNLITDFYLAVTDRPAYPTADLNNRAACFVTEQSHGVGMCVATMPKPTTARTTLS